VLRLLSIPLAQGQLPPLPTLLSYATGAGTVCLCSAHFHICQFRQLQYLCIYCSTLAQSSGNQFLLVKVLIVSVISRFLCFCVHHLCI